MREDLGSDQELDEEDGEKKIKIITVCRVNKFVLTKDKDRTRDLKILKWVAENEKGHC
jgi:hypothetical protein